MKISKLKEYSYTHYSRMKDGLIKEIAVMTFCINLPYVTLIAKKDTPDEDGDWFLEIHMVNSEPHICVPFQSEAERDKLYYQVRNDVHLIHTQD